MQQPVYGIGLLVVKDPRLLTDSLYKAHFNFVAERATQRGQIRRQIRDEQRAATLSEIDRLMWTTRHHEYKFSEVTSHNIQDYIDLLNIYFSVPNVEFHALLVDRLDDSFALSAWDHDSWKAYIWFAKQLLKRRLKTDAFVLVDLQGKPNDAEEFIEDTLCGIPHVTGCLRATSDMSIFLQLADVLLGCVQFDWKDQRGYYGVSSRRAEAKRNLTAFVKKRLRLPEGSHILDGDLLYKRRTRPSTFTAWRWKPAAVKEEGAAMSSVHPANGTT